MTRGVVGGTKWDRCWICSILEDQFPLDRDATSFSLLIHIPTIVIEEENNCLCKEPDMEEVKVVVFNLNGDNVGGPDDLNCNFYKCCWEIVGQDIFRIVQEFSVGNTLPKYISQERRS